MFSKLKFAWAAAFLCLALVGQGQAATVAPDAARCLKFGGVVETRDATYNTNGGTPLTLAGVAQFCRFTSKGDGSSIYVLLSTLNTTKPTLAALAYYAKVKSGSCEGSPGSCYCTLLGGTDLFGGINLSGGGWVLRSDATDVLDTCVFPDLSSIDSYGLFYHSAGIIRGKNLDGVLAYAKPK